MFLSGTNMRCRTVSYLNSFGRCHELMASFIMLTSCHWHGSDSLSAVTSVPAPRSTRRARNRWLHACGVEPSLHRDRTISGSKPHRNPANKHSSQSPKGDSRKWTSCLWRLRNVKACFGAFCSPQALRFAVWCQVCPFLSRAGRG